MPISDKINKIQSSKSIDLSRLISKLKSEGEDIIGLNVGELPEDAPSIIIEATKKSLDNGQTKYSNPEGISELRELLANNYSQEFDLNVEIDNIFIGNGSKHILYNIFQILTNPGDEFIVPIPYWVTIPESIKLAGGIPKFINTGLSELNIDIIKESITKNTKGIIINSPNNPSGKVYSNKSISALIKLCIKHDIYLISDEAYDKFVFDQEFQSPLNLASELDKIIIVKSFSKSFKMTGFRIGLMVASKQVIAASKKLQSHLSGNPCTFAQYGAIEAIKNAEIIIPPIVKDLKEKRDFAFKLFSSIFPMEKPEGGFYLFPNIENYIEQKGLKDCNEFAMYLLEHAKVAVLPGVVFGKSGHIRICFTQNKIQLEEAFERMKKVL